MKASSGRVALLRVLVCVVATLVAAGYFSHVRAQEGNNPKTMRVPLRPLAPLSAVPVPPIFGIEGILADKVSAIQLGKALFWEMQAGSDDTQACASCHFNAGADSRPMNIVNPGQAGGDNTFQLGPHLNGKIGPNYLPSPGTPAAGFGGYHDGDYPFHKLANVKDRTSVISDVNDISGSQGVFARSFNKVTLDRDGKDTQSTEVSTSIPDPVFSYPDLANRKLLINTRKTTGRNTPSVVNAVFNFRNFWDGRAQNVCNGNNPFGARDKNAHLLVVDATGTKLTQAFVSMKNSALCSQALGPILSSVEMSADGRDFHQVGRKLLARQPLAKQLVVPTDSVLGGLARFPQTGLRTTYSALVQKAFLPEWWNYSQRLCLAPAGTVKTINPARLQTCPSGAQEFSLMEYNFSLFWGVAIQMYESTLIADQTPLDKYLEQQKTYMLVGDSRKQQFTIHLQPNVDPFTFSMIELNPHNDFSDSNIYAFDNGYGIVQGQGVTQANINYAAGTLTVYFDIPPKAEFPVKISYSVGPTPLGQAQLRGFLLFQTKARCVACHGGPELSNASVQTVSDNPYERMIMGDFSVKVYDNGYYHIGVRPADEDAGLGGTDPIAGKSLSASESARQLVCTDLSQTFMVPGRPGDGIPQAPLSCRDEIASLGFFKAPQLRNIALTAPYFHNGGQLTLEQVVEFYDRGGDFNQGTELKHMDTDILMLGLTLQEKQDLVDFLRNGLTDPRTVVQSAPFDHPELVVAGGHPFAPNGYPVQRDPRNKGQALDSYIHVPPVGKAGGRPLSTFLENLLSGKAAR